jgi:hypothetical protein
VVEFLGARRLGKGIVRLSRIAEKSQSAHNFAELLMLYGRSALTVNTPADFFDQIAWSVDFQET